MSGKPARSELHGKCGCLVVDEDTSGAHPEDFRFSGTQAVSIAKFYEVVTGAPAPVVDTPFTDLPADSPAADDIARIWGARDHHRRHPLHSRPRRERDPRADGVVFSEALPRADGVGRRRGVT